MATNKKPVEMKEMNKNGGGQHDEQEEEDISQRPHIVPPDGGWGWVVMMAAFGCNIIVDGIIFSFGPIVSNLSEVLGEPMSVVAWVASLLQGFYLLAGPFVSSLANRFGFRAVACVGAILAGISLAVASLAESVVFLYVFVGVLGGIGFGLIYVPAVVAVGFYFEKRRALATGIAVCGSGIGTFVMAPLITWLLEMYGWRGTLLILAGLVMNCAIFGALFRPLEPVRPSKKSAYRSDDPDEASPGTPLMVRIKRDRDEELRKELEAEAEFKSSSHSINSPVKLVGLKAKTDSVSSLQRIKKEGAALLTGSKRSLRDLEPQPMDREDAFYTGSLHRLPQYRNDPENYHASVTKLPTVITTDDQPDGTNKQSSQSACVRVLSSMIQFSLFKSLTFDVLCVSSFITFLGFFVPFMYLAARAVDEGADKESASLLLSIIGITNTLGRVACGAFSDHPKVNVLLVSNTALTVGGLATIVTPFFPAYTMLIVYAAVFGLSIACFASLRSILLVELLGLENLTNAFGLSLLFTGISAVLGGPLAAIFYDATKDYNASFYLSGSMILVSGIMCYPLGYINRWEKRRNNASSHQAAVST